MSKFKELLKNDIVRKKPSAIIFVLLIVLYTVMARSTVSVAQSSNVIRIGSQVMPVAQLAGVMSSIALMSLVVMVVFYGRIGFYVSMFIYLLRAIDMVLDMFWRHLVPSMPGFFTSMVTFISIILIFIRSRKLAQYRETETERLKEQQRYSQRLFEQTATALVNAIDAKDVYSHGHSLRVAEYSRRIAEMAGKNEEECNKIYYTALLHDVGKIGIDEAIINKDGPLTNEEYEVIKTHTVMGNQILASISEYPYLSVGAFFHHERYDGKGYPSRMKGDDIPEIARIISVADAYDAMSSKRSYRDARPQQLVREEIVKGSGTQFDPKFASIMQHLIDLDSEYEMREKDTVRELAGRSELYCENFRESISDGILLTPFITKIKLHFKAIDNSSENGLGFIMYDALDGRVHDEEATIRDMNYYEYCVMLPDGKFENRGARKIQVKPDQNEKSKNHKKPMDMTYFIEAVKRKDHVLIKLDDGFEKKEVTIALPDSSRYVYIGLTGENCIIDGLSIDRAKTMVGFDYIPRIAEEISYIKGRPTGDVPNVQIDGCLTDASEAVPIKDGLQITFHTMSLPTARLIWHCPYIDIFHSSDKRVKGADYQEYALIRIDGENWEAGDKADNELVVNRKDDFSGWENWKKANKEGFDVTVNYKVDGNVVTVTTENNGLMIRNTTTILDGTYDLYTAITGDQVAITDIRVRSNQ